MNEFSLSDLAAVTGGNRNNDDGWGGGSGWWILLLFILLGGFNNGRGYGNQGGGYGAGGIGGNELYPWLNQSNQVNDGFRDQMLNATINGIQQGVNSLTTQLCSCCGDIQMALANGFNGVQQGMCNGFNGVNTALMGGFNSVNTTMLGGFNDMGMNMLQGFNGVNLGMLQGFNGVEQSANARQMADMQQAFAAQTAMMQGFNGLQAQQADCCCENRLATANQTATILAEHCADRAALSDGVRDIITSQGVGTQRILDKLCDLELANSQRELAAERRENANLRQQLQMADLRASQVAQTAQILQGQNNEVDALYQRLATCPVGTMPVYGNQPIFTCPQNQYGCGCNG